MTIGSFICHLPSGALFVLSGRVGDWLYGYDTAGLWARWPVGECAAVRDEPEPEPAGGWYEYPAEGHERDGEEW